MPHLFWLRSLTTLATTGRLGLYARDASCSVWGRTLRMRFCMQGTLLISGMSEGGCRTVTGSHETSAQTQGYHISSSELSVPAPSVKGPDGSHECAQKRGRRPCQRLCWRSVTCRVTAPFPGPSEPLTDQGKLCCSSSMKSWRSEF